MKTWIGIVVLCIGIMAFAFWYFDHTEKRSLFPPVSLFVPQFYTDDAAIAHAVEEWGIENISKGLQEHVLPGVSCHLAMHRVGYHLYRTSGFATISSCPTTCDSGCHHGILEQLAGENQHITPKELIALACGSAGFPQSPHACSHGLGHAFMYLYDFDTYAAHAACKGAPYPESCRGGVYMEYVIREETSIRKDYQLTRQTPFTRCISINPKESHSCFHYYAALYHQKLYVALESLESWCLSMPNDYISSCLLATVKLHHKYSPTLSEMYCKSKYAQTKVALESCSIGRSVGRAQDEKMLDDVLPYCNAIEQKEFCSAAVTQTRHELELKKTTVRVELPE